MSAEMPDHTAVHTCPEDRQLYADCFGCSKLVARVGIGLGPLPAGYVKFRGTPKVKNEDVIREIMSMLDVGYQEAKIVFRHAAAPSGTFKRVRKGAAKRDMSAEEAKRYVDAARKRIALVDEGG